MRFPLLRQGLNNAIRHLNAITQVSNINVLDAESTVTWFGRSPGIYKGMYYPLEYQHLLDRHRYSLLLSDGSFFQFFYRFEKNATDGEEILSQARLAYYPKPLFSDEDGVQLYEAAEGAIERTDENLYEHLFNWVEIMEIYGKSPSNTSHIRFDFDRHVTSHCQSHLQLSGIQELRIPAQFFPQPLAFVQLCEGLLGGLDPIDVAGMGFERNNFLTVARPDGLIYLGCSGPAP